MTKASRTPLGLLMALAAACSSGTTGFQPDPDPLPLDAAGSETANPCPESQPQVGSRCDLSDGTSCTFPNGVCTSPVGGVVYAETINYCCFDSIWSTCGGYSPCDLPEIPGSGAPHDSAAPDAPLDAGAAGDAAGDAGTGVDAPDSGLPADAEVDVNIVD